MSDTKRISGVRWTRERAAFLAIGCLLAGIAGGWCLHGPRTVTPGATPGAQVTNAPAFHPPARQAPQQADDSSQLKQMADAQAATLLLKLKTDPANADLLAGLGNLYYDARQYPVAVDYYARALKLRPADAAVRTDMGTAFWYMGNAPRAISEFNQALTYAPNNPNTLFNLGLVKWKANRDAIGAMAAWKKLLISDPAYPQRDQVEQMLAEARQAGSAH